MNDIMELRKHSLDWTSLDLSKNFEVGSRNVLGVNTDQLNEGIERSKKTRRFLCNGYYLQRKIDR